MVVLVRVDGEADHDRTQERRLGQLNTFAGEVIADVELELSEPALRIGGDAKR